MEDLCVRERERESLGRDGAASSVKTQVQSVCLDVQAAAEEQNNQQLSEVQKHRSRLLSGFRPQRQGMTGS